VIEEEIASLRTENTLLKASATNKANAELRAEVKRLREAAKPFARGWENMLPNITYQDWERLVEVIRVNNPGCSD